MSKLNNMDEKFEKSGIVSTILKFSVPSSIGAIVGMLCVLTDRYFIGQVAGRSGMSAVAIVFPYAMIMNSVNFLFSGIAINVGIKLGEKKQQRAEEILSSGFAWLVTAGILLTIILEILNVPLLKILGAKGETLTYALEYTKWLIPVATFQMILGQNTVIRGLGDPVNAMGVSIFTAVFNVILDYIFIMKMGMGIMGASLATFIATAISAVYIVIYLLRNKTVMLKLSKMKFNFNILKGIVKVGSPRFYNQILQSALVIITTRKAGIYGGDIATAAIGIISMIRNVINTSMMGFNQGTAAIISYKYGKRDFINLKKTVNVQLKIVSVISTSLVASMLIFTDFYSGFFVRSDFELIKFTSHAMRLNLFMMTSTAIFLSCNNFFQAIKDSDTASKFFLFRILGLNIPLIYILSYFFGEIGVWIGFPIADTVSAILIYRYSNKRLNELIKNNDEIL